MFAIGVRRDSDNTVPWGLFCIQRILCKSSFKKNKFAKRRLFYPDISLFLSINLSAGGRLCDRMMNEGSDWGMHHPSLTGGSIGMTQDCYCQVPACLHNSSLGCLHKKVLGCQIAKTTLHEPCTVTYC